MNTSTFLERASNLFKAEFHGRLRPEVVLGFAHALTAERRLSGFV